MSVSNDILRIDIIWPHVLQFPGDVDQTKHTKFKEIILDEDQQGFLGKISQRESFEVLVRESIWGRNEENTGDRQERIEKYFSDLNTQAKEVLSALLEEIVAEF